MSAEDMISLRPCLSHFPLAIISIWVALAVFVKFFSQRRLEAPFFWWGEVLLATCNSSTHLVTGSGGCFAFLLLLSGSNSYSQACPLQTAKSAEEAVREVSCEGMLKYFCPS